MTVSHNAQTCTCVFFHSDGDKQILAGIYTGLFLNKWINKMR